MWAWKIKRNGKQKNWHLVTAKLLYNNVYSKKKYGKWIRISFSFLVFEKSGDYVFGFHQCFIFWLKNYWIFFMSSGMPVREENKTFMKVKNRKRHNCEMNDCRNATTHQFSQFVVVVVVAIFPSLPKCEMSSENIWLTGPTLNNIRK